MSLHRPDNPAKILVVENDPFERDQLAQQIKRLGYRITDAVGDGAAAAAAAERDRPDLAIMDIVLPGEVDGIDAAVHIRNQLGIPALFLTAFSDPLLIERARAARPVAFVLKPLRLAQLKAILTTAVDSALFCKGAEQALIACESRLDAAVESSLIPFGACKALRDETGGIMDFEVVRLNRPAADFLGLNDAEAVGRRVNELLPNLVGQGLFEELRQVVETGRPAEKRGFAYQDRIDGRSIEGRFDLRAVKSEDGFAATWRRAGDQG